MFIKRLLINNFRNIESLDLEPCEGFNFICGANGSGKTSVLEAIYYLSLARSFRTNTYQYLIKQGSSGFNLFAKVQEQSLKANQNIASNNLMLDFQEASIEEPEQYFSQPSWIPNSNFFNSEVSSDLSLNCSISPFSTSIGLSRSKGSDFVVKINSMPLYRLIDLLEHTCIQLIHPQGVELITNDAEGRRSFVDWGVYYSDLDFKSLWLKYRKILKQRNALLRRESYKLGGNKANVPHEVDIRTNLESAELTMWDDTLVTLSEQITEKRLHYLKELQVVLSDLIRQFLPDFKLKFELNYGWDKSSDLRSILARNLEKERVLGYTMYGCHRADLKIKNNTVAAGATLSRGQLKMLVYAMRLAQGMLLKQQTARSCIYLIDDLNSELDSNSQSVLLNTLVQCKHQVFISNIQQDLLIPKERSDYKVFSLDRGSLA